METMKQGVIKLIPKPGKDILSNLTPITILNTDFKILATVLARRLKTEIMSTLALHNLDFSKVDLYITTPAWFWILLIIIT